MKKVFFAALLAVSVAGTAFATPSGSVSYRVLTHFTADFGRPADVTWTIKDDFVKASFTKNNERVEAFYTVEGEMIGTSKEINLKDLPEEIKKTMENKYPMYAITAAILFENNEESAYFVSTQNEKETLIIKISLNNQVSVFSQKKK